VAGSNAGMNRLRACDPTPYVNPLKACSRNWTSGATQRAPERSEGGRSRMPEPVGAARRWDVVRRALNDVVVASFRRTPGTGPTIPSMTLMTRCLRGPGPPSCGPSIPACAAQRARRLPHRASRCLAQPPRTQAGRRGFSASPGDSEHPNGAALRSTRGASGDAIHPPIPTSLKRRSRQSRAPVACRSRRSRARRRRARQCCA
jgi:hypothetical protein